MSIVLNWVDLGFIIFFLLSILFGFIRGFIRSVVSLLFLILAVYLAIKYAPLLAAHFTSHDKTISYLALIGIFLLIFIVTILVGAVLSYFLNMAFQLSGLGFINSFFGGLFGVVRAAIISVFIIYVVQLTPASTQVMWSTSYIVLYFTPMTAWLEKNLSPKLEDLKETMSKVGTIEFKK